MKKQTSQEWYNEDINKLRNELIALKTIVEFVLALDISFDIKIKTSKDDIEGQNKLTK